MSEKQIVHKTLKSFLKAVRDSNHAWVYIDSIQATIDKRVKVEGVEISIYFNHVYPIESTQYSYMDQLTYTAIDLDYGDFSNLKNFLNANKPDKLYWVIYSDNSSDWMKERNISHETVHIEACKIRKDGSTERIPFNRFEANRLYDKTQGPHHYFKMMRTTPTKPYKELTI